MWRELIDAIAASGRCAIAPDLPGFGATPADPPGTWERHVEALERFRMELGIERLVLVVHDWGGLVGIRWACEHPDALAGLVVANTGFFPDGKWHGFAKMLRTPGQGEEIAAALTPELLGQTLRAQCSAFTEEAIADYVRCAETEEGRRGMLELYRSGDFEKIAAYDGCLGAMAVPALALWGADDEFAPIPGAYRFAKELPDCEVVAIEGAGHFVFAEEPERCTEAVLSLLARVDQAVGPS